MLSVGRSSLVTSDGTAILSSTSPFLTAAEFYPRKWAYCQNILFFTEGLIDPNVAGTLMPIYFQDQARAFYVNQATTLNGNAIDYRASVQAFKDSKGDPTQLGNWLASSSGAVSNNGPQFQFTNLYHPFVHYFTLKF